MFIDWVVIIFMSVIIYSIGYVVGTLVTRPTLAEQIQKGIYMDRRTQKGKVSDRIIHSREDPTGLKDISRILRGFSSLE